MIVHLIAGEGGDDSKRFVDELTGVYILYAAKKGLNTEIIAEKDGNISLQITGTGVWEAFKNEIGKHQVQRIPPNERSGRVHTSIIAVGVLRLFKFQGKSLNQSDLEIKTQCGGGPGGQHRNKTESAVRMTHKPTGLQVFINSGRDQHQNKQKALEILTSRVNEHLYELAHADYAAKKKIQMGDSARGSKVRTYHFKNGFISNEITGKSTNDIKGFMKGNIDLVR